MSRTFVDWYAFRSKTDQRSVFEALRTAMGGNGGLLGHTIQARGWQGYEACSLLNFAGVPVGLMAWGGEHQLGWIHASLSGAGCEFVEAWDYFEAVTQALPEFDYRRVDLTLDVRDGSCTHERTVAAYRAGAFDHRNRRPKGDRREPEECERSSTFYVGNRKGWKFFRGYDKGKEIREKSGMQSLTHIGGTPVEDLYRFEVEFKAKDDVLLPLDLVADRDRYFAGAYPYLATVLGSVEARPFRIHRRHQVHSELDRALAACRRSYGPALRAAQAVHGNLEAVWERIVGDQLTDRWIRAGARIKADDL